MREKIFKKIGITYKNIRDRFKKTLYELFDKRTSRIRKTYREVT